MTNLHDMIKQGVQDGLSLNQIFEQLQGEIPGLKSLDELREQFPEIISTKYFGDLVDELDTLLQAEQTVADGEQESPERD